MRERRSAPSFRPFAVPVALESRGLFPLSGFAGSFCSHPDSERYSHISFGLLSQGEEEAAWRALTAVAKAEKEVDP